MKHFQINDLKLAAIKCSEEIETNMAGYYIMFYISENIPSKTVNVEGLSDDCEVTLIELFIKCRNGSVLVSTSPLHKMKSISLITYHLL